MIKKIKRSWFYVFYIIFVVVFCSRNLPAHEGQRMQLFAEIEQSRQNLLLTNGSLARTLPEFKTFKTEAEFISLLSNSASKPIVMMVGSAMEKNTKSLDAVCNNAGVSFYALDIEKSSWMVSWLAKQLSYTAQTFPLFLFFQGKELLLPLCQGNIPEDLFLEVIQRKFKGLALTQGIALQKNDSLKSRLFPHVDFILTATSMVKVK